MQWHRPVTALSSSSTPMTTQSTQHSKPKQMNSSIPFRELLLQQQQHQQQQQQLLLQQQQHQQQTKLLAADTAAAASSIASGNVPTTNTEITASAIISSAVEQDRIALATHFQERDRLILQHQQHQLQRKQKHQKQLNEHEKPFSSTNRIRDFVIGGSGGSGGVDRVTNIAAGKTSGKWFRFIFLLLLPFFSLSCLVFSFKLQCVCNVCNLQIVDGFLCWFLFECVCEICFLCSSSGYMSAGSEWL